MTPRFPVDLLVEGRSCLVVGGGRVAARKAAGLAAAGAHVTVVAPDVCADAEAVPGVHLERRRYRRGEVAGYWLVITATGDPAVDQAVHDDGEAVCVWVNSADDPARCTFTLPAVHRQGAVSVAVSTGGASPALASWLRDQLAAHVGREFAVVAERLAAARARIHAAGRSTESWCWPARIEAELAAAREEGTIGAGSGPAATGSPSAAGRTGSAVTGSGPAAGGSGAAARGRAGSGPAGGGRA
jgi:siroheme synthase-like protein